MATKVQGPDRQSPSRRSGEAGPAKRAYHSKSRTGCRTCKIRRVRCDEGKPDCTRCITTGRKCDGYATYSSTPLPKPKWRSADLAVTPTADRLLQGVGKSLVEMRSYCYFMEVTALSVAGALNADFWLQEIPKLASNDDAIWHAVVSLGSAHEAYVSGVQPKPEDSVFTLQQFNTAIQRLSGSYSADGWWRALTISAIFATICVLEGKFQEAILHFKHGYLLLKEFDDPSNPPLRKDLPDSANMPVSISSVRSVFTEFEMRCRKTETAKISSLPTLLGKPNNFTSWASYVAPQCSPDSGIYMTPDNLRNAVQNSEALLMGLLFSSIHYAHQVKGLYLEGKIEQINSPGPTQEPLLRCFNELEKTRDFFQKELADRHEKGAWRKGESHLRQAFLCLEVFQMTNHLLLRHDPQHPNHAQRLESFPKLCEDIIKLSTVIINLDKKYGCIRSGNSIATPALSNCIALVVKCGFGYATRRKAIELFKRPRLEGVWDSLMAAAFAQAILEREMEATQEYNTDPNVQRLEIDDFSARGFLPSRANSKDDIHPLARVLFTGMHFTNGREARMELRTWREWLEDSPSRSVWIYW